MNEAAPRPPPRYTLNPLMPSLIEGTKPISAILTSPCLWQQAKLILNLPRKFKINFACCHKHGLVRIADIGLVPSIKDGMSGFKVYLGGGLGAASFIGHLLEDFTPENKLLSTRMATIRLFDRHGNRENMAKKRMPYLVHEMGGENSKKML